MPLLVDVEKPELFQPNCEGRDGDLEFLSQAVQFRPSGPIYFESLLPDQPSRHRKCGSMAVHRPGLMGVIRPGIDLAEEFQPLQPA